VCVVSLPIVLACCRSKSADQSGSYTTREWIERIIVLGFPSEPKSVQAADGSEFGFRYDGAKSTLEIKKPSSNVNQDVDIAVTV